VNGICVTSYTTERDNSGTSHSIPYDGFRIDEQLGKFGGFTEALKVCQSCEANVRGETAARIAGCFGYLDVWPDSKELDAQLRSIIEERGLRERLHGVFPVTTPLWYGFWINSPLRRIQVEFLSELLGEVCDHDNPQDKDVAHFLSALQAALAWELPVHVSVAPPGHTDFGFYTIFPHCPRCKAAASVGRWQESYSEKPYSCKVCGHVFNPNEHHSSVQDDRDWDANTLEKQLGKQGFEDFTKQFLMYRGCTEQQVQEIKDNQNNGPLRRKVAKVLKQRRATLQRLRREQAVHHESELPATVSFSLRGGVALKLVRVPAGEFLMGSSAARDEGNEVPQHLVRFERPFYIGQFPVTQAQWEAVMGNNPSHHKGSGDLPIDRVSWFDCQAFCDALCKQQRRVFRLPSEAEWEYACRAGTTTTFAFGDTLSPKQANFVPYARLFGKPPTDEAGYVREMELLAATPENRVQGKARPTPVGSYPPNAWGIYDMHGNVDEWCDDAWHPNYLGAPVNGTAWMDGADEAIRVLRGGWCAATEFVCTSSARRSAMASAGTPSRLTNDPEASHQDDFMNEFLEMLYMPYGFRVVCEA
jgi:formylglycine-generating enzyme required for sulfatase activity